jgi:hypothetical protein
MKGIAIEGPLFRFETMIGKKSYFAMTSEIVIEDILRLPVTVIEKRSLSSGKIPRITWIGTLIPSLLALET